MKNITDDQKEILITFIKWYWKEVEGKPYDINSEEVVNYFIDDVIN